MSTSAGRLSVLIPCYNEAEGLDYLEEVLPPALDRLDVPYEVITIDDGSTDGTGDKLEELARRQTSFHTVSHRVNRGLGAALRTGFAEAKGLWIIVLDADMTFSPDFIGTLLETQKKTGADCVSGSPFLGGMPGVPWTRRLPSLALNAFYRGLLCGELTSFTPLFRLYRASALRKLDLQSDGFEISAEILALLLRVGARVREVPVPLSVRVTGESKLQRMRELKNHAALAVRLLRY